MLVRILDVVHKNQQYISRAKQETEMIEQLKNKAIVVLKGQPKVGKTALASHYYFNSEEKYDYSFWLCGSSKEILLQNLKRIIDENDGLPEKIKALANEFKNSNLDTALKKLKHVFEKLSEKWLIVIDDLSIKELDLLLPVSSVTKQHHVIITTSQDKHRLLSSHAPTAMVVNEFTEEEIEELFQKRLNSDLNDFDKENIKKLRRQFHGDLDLLIIASRFYAEQATRTAILEINQDQRLSPIQIRQKMKTLEISNDDSLLEELMILSLFKNNKVYASWFPAIQNNFAMLKNMETLSDESESDKKIILAPSKQVLFNELLVSTEMTFNDYGKFYLKAIDLLKKAFVWTRANYDKKLKIASSPNYPQEQAQLADFGIVLLSQFSIWQNKIHAQFTVSNLKPIVTLANSLGRHYFIQEWFQSALEYYQTAKNQFDFLLTQSQRDYLFGDNRSTKKNKKIFQTLSDELGSQICWIYAQEVLHNIGATTVKINWDVNQKAEQLKVAINSLQLAYDWQTFLIENSSFDQSLIEFIAEQLSKENLKTASIEIIKGQLYHFANFTRRLLAQAYIQQKDLQQAQKIYEELINDVHYMDRVETKPLAYRDLANVLRRQNQLDDSLGYINNHAESLVEVLKDHPTASVHYRGEKEQVLYEKAKIYLAIYIKDKVRNDLLLLAEENLLEVIKLGSNSSLYKAKAYYQLAQISSLKANLIDQQKYLELAITNVSGRSKLKEKAYRDYHQSLASHLTEADKKILEDFNDKFIVRFLMTLKTTLIELKNDPHNRRLKLASGILQGIFKLIPDIEVTATPVKVTIKNSVSELIKTIMDSIIEYRNQGNKVVADEIESKNEKLQLSTEMLAQLITTQYSYQICRLTADDIDALVKDAVNVLIDFIKEGKLLTENDHYTRHSVQEQLLKVLIDEMPNTKLTTLKPEIYQKWNAHGFFSKSAFLVKDASGEVELYARAEAKRDRHKKYGYSVLSQKPIPHNAFTN